MVEVYTISESQAVEIAKIKLGTDKVQIAESGRNNWVFLSSDKVISIPRNNEKINYSIRVGAINLLTNNGIPTTDIIEYNSEGIEHLITKRVNGVNLDISDLSVVDRLKVHTNTGILLKKIHDIKVKDFGRLDGNLKGSHKDWKGFVSDYFLQSMKRLYTSKDLWKEFGSILTKEFENHINMCDVVKNPIFLHGDYHLGNLLFSNTDVNAVIDLDIVMSGDPIWDITHYCRTFNIDRNLGVRKFKDAYGYNSDNSKFERFYAMTIWTRKIASQGENRREALKETIPEMEKILKWEI